MCVYVFSKTDVFIHVWRNSNSNSNSRMIVRLIDRHRRTLFLQFSLYLHWVHCHRYSSVKKKNVSEKKIKIEGITMALNIKSRVFYDILRKNGTFGISLASLLDVDEEGKTCERVRTITVYVSLENTKITTFYLLFFYIYNFFFFLFYLCIIFMS